MKRYRVDFGYGRYYFEPNDAGDWVRFEDHEAEVARLVPLKGGVPVREWALQENLKLAEEGLANYAQSNETLTQQRDHWLAAARTKDEQVERLQGERAAAIDRLTPLGCEVTRLRTALEEIAKHRLRGRKTQGALIAEAALDCLREPQEAKHE